MKGPARQKDTPQRRPRQQRPQQPRPNIQEKTQCSDVEQAAEDNLKISSKNSEKLEENNNKTKDEEENTEPSKTPPTPPSTPQEEKLTEELSKDVAISREINAVEQYRIQQKVMEEQNKKKKQLLAEALVARQKKTKQEAVKLQKIKQQLEHLDHILSIDVSIVRDKIEEASREYVEAQKRYDRAEKEFVASKLDLHEKQELKDQLTEHLYTIIHQNELRKAKKLTELMESLDLENSENISISIEGVPGATLLFEHGSPQTTPSNEKPPTENLEKPKEESKSSEAPEQEKSNNATAITEQTDTNSVEC